MSELTKLCDKYDNVGINHWYPECWDCPIILRIWQEFQVFQVVSGGGIPQVCVGISCGVVPMVSIDLAPNTDEKLEALGSLGGR